MSTTGNKKVTQLTELLGSAVQSNDLLYIIDVSAKEGKKIQTNQLSAYLNASGSIYAVHAITADTASLVLGSGVSGLVASASNALNAVSASHALKSDMSVSSSHAITASYVVTSGTSVVTADSASFLIYSANNGTASHAITSNTSINSYTASFLQYLGTPNGTASHAIVSDTSTLATTATTALSVISASHALVADFALNSPTGSDTASYLIYSPNNGTASYAIVAGSTVSRLSDFGIFLAVTQSSYSADIDDLVISSSLGSPQQTIIEAFGTAILSYTSSIPNSSTLNLHYVNRLTGQTGSLDSAQLSYNVTPIMNQWNSLSSGSMNIPFTLIGQTSLYGNYYVAVTSSANNIALNPNRTVKFRVSSFADNVYSASGDLLDFYLSPSASTSITFSSLIGGPFYDYLPGLLATGSQKIVKMDISNQSVDTIRYTWKCINLTDFSCSNNPSLTQLNYSFPATMSNLYCSSCSLTSIVDLSNTQLINFDCSNNQLLALPALPDTVEHLECSNNPIAFLPALLPSSLETLYCNTCSIFSVDLSSSVNLLTASFQGGVFNANIVLSLPDNLRKLSIIDTGLISLLTFSNPTASLPISMSYLNVTSCSLSALPSMSISMSYLNISHNPFMSGLQTERTTSELIANAQLTGSYIRVGDGAPSLVTKINLITLSASYGWTIQHDGFP